ncbi:hypothetical protein RYA05_00620 [Pseudomonas syringae pv. actinidiae]|nr:hypothetical protein [Pseudomonas syringae pv. actinidiae]
MRGAGGTEGGVGRFLIGLLMMAVGFYLLLNAIVITSSFGFGSRLYSFQGGSYGVTSGMIMIPFIIGIGIVFYDYKKVIGWLLAIGSLSAMIVGVIASIKFAFKPMSSFDLIVILTLAIGGLGTFASSFKKAQATAVVEEKRT